MSRTDQAKVLLLAESGHLWGGSKVSENGQQLTLVAMDRGNSLIPFEARSTEWLQHQALSAHRPLAQGSTPRAHKHAGMTAGADQNNALKLSAWADCRSVVNQRH